MEDDKPNTNVGAPIQKVENKNALSMNARTQFAKEESSNPKCEKEGCDNDMPVAFHMTLGNQTKKYCESCYRDYWREQGFIRQ